MLNNIKGRNSHGVKSQSSKGVEWESGKFSLNRRREVFVIWLRTDTVSQLHSGFVTWGVQFLILLSVMHIFIGTESVCWGVLCRVIHCFPFSFVVAEVQKKHVCFSSSKYNFLHCTLIAFYPRQVPPNGWDGTASIVSNS